MLRVRFDSSPGSIQRVLCLGSHCDDIEIGCGGTLLKLIKSYPNLEVYWVVFSSNPQRKQEAYASTDRFLEKATKKYVKIKAFKDGFFPFVGSEIKACFEQLKQEFTPDIIFTHHRQDLHQDHRCIADFTWNTFRNHLILEYEIPKYDGDLGHPNFFVHLDRVTCKNKIDYIVNSFQSQQGKQWFTEETFWSILRLRGIESNSPSMYAEAFHCRKVVF